MLLLATARHELLESHADWGEREGSRRLVLQPLGEAATAQIVANLLGSSGLPPAVLARIVAAAEGNPLYVEQMLSMLLDNGTLRRDGERWVSDQSLDTTAVPPTIHALLEARLDRLERSERAAAEPAAVIGMEFQRPAVEALAPEALRNNVVPQLEKLSAKQFIRAVSSAEKELLYRFHHHLVRETVYNGLLKRARAKLHMEFVRWADKLNADNDRAQEFEAILGYHLEQAYQYLGELGPYDEAGNALGRDGARRLTSAARRAFARGDSHAANNLYRRAIAMLADHDPQRLPLLPDLAEVLIDTGDFARSRVVLDEAIAAAETQGNPRVDASARLKKIYARDDFWRGRRSQRRSIDRDPGADCEARPGSGAGRTGARVAVDRLHPRQCRSLWRSERVHRPLGHVLAPGRRSAADDQQRAAPVEHRPRRADACDAGIVRMRKTAGRRSR